ncbi:MAG: hypothetical protein ACYS8Z_00930, partial [Planctomycetota bacterium]
MKDDRPSVVGFPGERGGMHTKNYLRILVILPVFLSSGVPVASVGKTIYVDTDVSVDGNGTSWAMAFKYLQDALVVADANDEIRVAQGTYLPDCNSSDPNGSGDRSASFHLINGVIIRGGYAGCGEPDPNVRDVESYETVLSGDLA